jgi:hemerythrin-like metal-binding protein
MAFYEWTETMSVGVDLFDSDHKALIGLINRLHESLEGDEPAPLGEIFDTLIAYAELHFAREEKGLEACRYPEIEIHRDQHAGFTDRIYRARERYPGGSDPARTGELLDYLKLWLNHHILIQDMAYKPYAAGDREVERVARSFGPGLADSGGRAGPFESKHAAPTAEPG